MCPGTPCNQAVLGFSSQGLAPFAGPLPKPKFIGTFFLLSKAFTKEADDRFDDVLLAPRPALPPGSKNYLTADGAARFREKVTRLMEERAAVAANPASEKLKRIDAQLRRLEEILGSADIVDPATSDRNSVRFGAVVTVRDQHNEEDTYRIVGVDEIDLDRGWISWLSPLAKALTGRSVGERIKFKTPAGERQLEIVRISYEYAG